MFIITIKLVNQPISDLPFDITSVVNLINNTIIIVQIFSIFTGVSLLHLICVHWVRTRDFLTFHETR